MACGIQSQSGGTQEKVVIGYFPNINHVAVMVAEEKQLYEQLLPDGTEVVQICY
jgi:NitT/TauT family transport system substrate-binding protein